MSRTIDTTTDRTDIHRAGPHWAALVAAAFTWPLLLVGGSVTVYRVGMAVPDWPTTFGVNMFLYNFLDSPWGVYLEHGHRLYGSVVGLACIVLAVRVTVDRLRNWRTGLGLVALTLASGFLPLLLPTDANPAVLSSLFTGLLVIAGVSLILAAWFAVARRAAVPALAWFALAAVIGQGILGGYRVRLNSTDLAFVHGCTAQIFFGLLVALCVLTGHRWARSARDVTDTSNLRLHASVALGLVLAQIVLGAWLRHYGTPTALGAHAGFAAAVGLYAAATGSLALRRRALLPELAPSAIALLASVVGQVVLGVIAWWVLRPFDGIPRTVLPGQAAIRIAHQGVGALLLASAVVLAMRSYRRLRSPIRVPDNDSTSPATPPRDLEPVA